MDLAAVLAGTVFWRGPGIFTGNCPCCSEALEFQVGAGKIELGYTYWAGSMHFEGVVEHRVAGLRRADSDGAIALELAGVVYPVRAVT
jgi:hypothetical protein